MLSILSSNSYKVIEPSNQNYEVSWHFVLSFLQGEPPKKRRYLEDSSSDDDHTTRDGGLAVAAGVQSTVGNCEEKAHLLKIN